MGGRVAGDLAARLGRATAGTFVGRAAERELVAASLAGTPDFAVLFVHGPGGIGKSALLRRMALDAEAAGVTPVAVDARTFAPHPEGFLAAVGEQLGVPADEDPLPVLQDCGRLLLVVDTFERCAGLQGWLRERFLPRLPADALTVIAGREPPEAAWRFDPSWEGLLRAVTLRNLPPDDAGRLLAARGVPPRLRESALALAGGHPLALCLVAEATARDGAPAALPDPGAPDLLRPLLERIVDEAPSPRHRAALEVCAHARVTTESLLRAVLGGPGSDELFAWLSARSFVERATEGLHPHDLARDVLDAELRWRDPDRYADLHRRIRQYLVDRLRRSPADGPRIWRDLMFLHRRNPVYAPFMTWDADGGFYEDAAGPGDRAAVVAMTRAAEGEASAAVLEHWLDRRPEGCRVYRRAGRSEPAGFALHLALSCPDPADLAADPVVAAAWSHVETSGRLRPGEHVDLLRTFVVPGAYHRPSPVMDLIQVTCAHSWTTRSGLAMSFLVLAEPAFWAAQMAYIEHSPRAPRPSGTGRSRSSPTTGAPCPWPSGSAGWPTASWPAAPPRCRGSPNRPGCSPCCRSRSSSRPSRTRCATPAARPTWRATRCADPAS
ncbi:hypothetical protein [Blastococcus sp. PRF04-17]|uniref:hypothetical protein n=1 Tax=Blastococcus sp. PRF04-17 TaxID=2933797 RepID=UPI001FF22F6C|nr:hypothetical protein [Blastococcus sp. PRF04-17]UOY03654.1 hypothetical protein MVA48_10120 [Blastococcus sp. PRF04-17]